MLSAVEVTVYPKRDCVLPHPCAKKLHAALLGLVRENDPAMSEALHDDVQVKPFAISTLWPRGRTSGESLSIPKYTACRFRLSTLQRPIYDVFSQAIFTRLATNSSITLGDEEFVVIDANMEPPHGGAASYEELWERRSTIATLRFVSPTTFRRKGLNVPLPEPSLVFGSLWQKWQAFSGIDVSEDVFEEMLSALAASRLRIRSRTWKYSNFMLTGFTGEVCFQLVKCVNEDAERLFGALSLLAFYSGVGYRTTMGMGQCRLVLDDPIQSVSECVLENCIS